MRKYPKLQLEYPIKLDCGCADQKKEGYLGIDNVDYGQEIIWDLRDGIPLPDESVQDLNACHLLEHFTNKESKAFITEVKRVLIHGGTLTAQQPHVVHPTAFYPDHESFWNEARVESIVRNDPEWEMVYNRPWQLDLIFQLKKK